MWVEFVVGSRLAPGVQFSPGSAGSPVSPSSPGFLPPQKPTSPNSNSTRIGSEVRDCGKLIQFSKERGIIQ